MKRILLIALLLSFALYSFSQDLKYSRIKIYLEEQGLAGLARMGLDITQGEYKKGRYFTGEFSEREIQKIKENGLDFEVLIDDMTRFYIERNQDLDTRNISDLMDDYPVPEGWEFGTCGGFYTVDQMIAELDTMYMLYPDLITEKEQIGTTYEGRPIYAVKISDNPNTPEDEPEVLYNGMHHAREPIGMQLLIYYMYYLLENYDTDSHIQALVDETEMYFIPVINVDGYEYNISNYPNGGGMWRKTRRDNGGGEYGVDPNRNYDYMWGYDNIGSSPNPDDNTYRGPYAFSEPCVQTVRDYCIDHEFGIALNYHSYSNLLLYPWGYDYIVCPDDDVFYAFGHLMITDNNYALQQGVYLYPTNGGSDDWMYGEQDTKNLIFSYTPEVGSSNDGFWPSMDRIIPLCQENMIQNIYAARLVGRYATVSDANPAIIAGVSGELFFDIQRLGLAEGGVFTVSIAPLGSNIVSTGDPVEFTDLEMMEIQSGSVDYELDPDIQSGDEFTYALSVDNGSYVITDTITKVYGQPLVIFEDDANNFLKWNSYYWDVTTEKFHSPSGSITDSPGSNYANNQVNRVTLNDEIDLTTAAYAVLNFWASWEIEAGWDFVQVLASDDGVNWTPLEGKYTITGNENQAYNEPLYDGFQTEFVEETILLNDFLGESILLRFVLESDYYVNEDGFYFDDVKVTIIDNLTSVDEQPAEGDIHAEVYPNPARDALHLNYVLPGGINRARLKVSNATGQIVFEQILSEKRDDIIVDVSDWQKGIYYYTISGPQGLSHVEKVIVY